MKSRLHLMISKVSGKTLIAVILISLLALPVLCIYARRSAVAAARYDARLHSSDLKQRTVALCAALGDNHPTIGEPDLIVQKFHTDAPHRPRRLWVVECLAGPHHYNVIFNDLTGNIESLYSEGLSSSSAPAPAAPLMALASPGDAVEGSIRRLQDLQMTPKGTRIVLAQRPERDRDGIGWRIVWKVLRPDAVNPYEVRMVLDGRDATPMIIVNCGELDNYLQNGG